MNAKKYIVATGAVAGTAAALFTAASAAAYPETSTFGTQQQLNDAGGAVVAAWTVSELRPSSDAVAFPVQGTLWEATATVDALRGTVTPIVSNFNARDDDGTNYRALATVATPQGVNPSPLAEGTTETGKVYFDVVGPTPDDVVYSNGVEDLLIWE
ncbi:MAG: MPT63 family protein [Mycobacterium sp.]|nr:MPT63 family protein [Mycobacterium sp.]